MSRRITYYAQGSVSGVKSVPTLSEKNNLGKLASATKPLSTPRPYGPYIGPIIGDQGPIGPYTHYRGPGPYRAIYPSPSEFTHHLQNLPTTFRIYPPPSEFTHHLQNLPTPFRIYPPPSEFTHPLGPKKLTLGPVDLFGPKKRRCSSLWDVGEIEFTNDRLTLKICVNPTSWC